MRGLDHFQDAFFWSWEKYLEGFDFSVPAPFLEFRENPLGVFLVVCRPDMMRARAKPAHVFALVVRAGNCAELRFPVAFGRGTGARETLQRFVLRSRGHETKQKREQNSRDRHASHPST